MMSDRNNGLLNDVLIVGNELSGKLNEIGVSNTFGRASEGKDDLISLIRMAIDGIDMVVDEKSYVSLTATNPYLLTGETTDIVAKLRNGVCRPLTNKNLIIGKSVFIDEGTTSSHNDSWRVTNGTMTRMDSYTRLVESAQTLMCQMDSAYINPTSIVEFDFKAVDGVKNWGLVYIRNSGGGVSLADLNLNQIGGEIGEWIHLKIVFNNTDTITIYSSKLDNPITRTLSSTDTNYRLLLYCGGTNTELHFKNVIVYETINGVTDGNGEFTLNDVSVTDKTTFIANYESVSDTYTVHSCIYRDYATSDTNSRYYINSIGGTSLSWNNGYLVLTLGSKGRYVRLKTGQYDVNNLLGKKVHFEAEIDADISCYVQLLDDNTGNVYAKANGNEVTKGISQLDYVIPSNCTQVLFQITAKDQTGSDGTIKFKNFVIY